jgi:hypothetical protein
VKSPVSDCRLKAGRFPAGEADPEGAGEGDGEGEGAGDGCAPAAEVARRAKTTNIPISILSLLVL